MRWCERCDSSCLSARGICRDCANEAVRALLLAWLNLLPAFYLESVRAELRWRATSPVSGARVLPGPYSLEVMSADLADGFVFEAQRHPGWRA